MAITAGCHKISEEEYHNDPCSEPSLSRGAIMDLLDCPQRAFFNHPRLNPYPLEEKEETKFDIGSAAHDLLLEGGDKIFVVEGFDDWRKKEAKEARDAARREGKTPLLEKQYHQVVPMVETAKTAIGQCEELGIVNLQIQGDSELTYVWRESNGVWCRIRVDWIRKNRNLILDYKTTGTSANPEIFSGHINKMGYGIQSVYYRRGVKAVEGKEPNFVIMAQETEPPYFCSFHGLDLQNEDTATKKVGWAIKTWGECLATEKWEGYPNRICYAEPKPWELAEWAIWNL